MKTLHLHIGTRKTGTTSIQENLYKNIEVLNKQGFGVFTNTSFNQYEFALAADSNLKLFYYHPRHKIQSNNDVLKYHEEIKFLIKKSVGSFDNYIISSEDCSLLNDIDSVDMLKKLFSAEFDKILIYVYLRRQDQYIISDLSTSVLNGLVIKDPNEQSILQKTHDYSYLNYKQLLDCYSSAFGIENINCSIFSREKLKNGNVVDDLFHKIGIEEYSYFEDNSNSSISYDAFSFLNSINKIIPLCREDGNYNPSRGDINQYLKKFFSGKEFHIDKQDISIFKDKFDRDNIELCKKYFDSEINFFSLADNVKSCDKKMTLSIDNVVNVSSLVILNNHKEIYELKEKNHRLYAELNKNDKEIYNKHIKLADQMSNNVKVVLNDINLFVGD